MMSSRETLLCRYHYDPLDRLIDCARAVQGTLRRFYLKDRLTTEIQGAEQCSIVQHDDQLLALQQCQDGIAGTHLLGTDLQRSVLNVLNATRPHPLAYSPYGHRPAENGLLSLLGFNGERPDPLTGYYLLGNGYRAFNPVLMRFNSPDSWSPFGEGGLNAYAYCLGDPVNLEDRTGHAPWLVKLIQYFSPHNSTTKRLIGSTADDTVSLLSRSESITDLAAVKTTSTPSKLRVLEKNISYSDARYKLAQKEYTKALKRQVRFGKKKALSSKLTLATAEVKNKNLQLDRWARARNHWQIERNRYLGEIPQSNTATTSIEPLSPHFLQQKTIDVRKSQN